MTANPELASGDLIAGKYRIERVLGRGGMGAVYLATNEDLGRRVAIKVLLEAFARDENLLRRFRQEARTAAAIGHPGIVDVLDLGTTADGSPFIVMEALEGETLGARIARERRMDVAESVAIVAQTLDALAAAHDKEILHRDLKPDNLFLVARQIVGVKILDFGISKLGGAGEDVSLTHTGAIFGTPLYMSAEQARGAKYVTAASDLYSVGAILYQMLAGRTPFLGESYNELIANVLTGSFTPIGELRKDVPAALGALVDRMLSRDPALRPATAREARSQLLEAARDLQAGAARASASDGVATTAAPGAALTVATGAPVSQPVAGKPVAPPVGSGTTGVSLGELSNPAPAPRSRGAWLGAAAVAAGGAIVAIVVARGGGHDEPHTAAPADARALVAPLDASGSSATPVAVTPDAATPDAGADRTVHKDPVPHRDAGVAHSSPVDAGASPRPPDAKPSALTIDTQYP